MAEDEKREVEEVTIEPGQPITEPGTACKADRHSNCCDNEDKLCVVRSDGEWAEAKRLQQPNLLAFQRNGAR